MNPLNWVDQLYTYGPYAVLALFVLWVAPAQLKAFRENPGNDRTKQAISGLVALGSWLIVFAMVGYIYLFWPPRTVYLGSFGNHTADAHFYSTTPELFVSSRPVGGGRLTWDYVVVAETRSRSTGAADTFDFAYQWGPGARDYADFSLPLRLLRKRHIDFYSDPEHPDMLLYDDDNDPATPRKPYPRIAGAQAVAMPTALAAVVTTAQAQERSPTDTISLPEWLASPNGNLRAQARAQLRQMSPDELVQLLQTRSLSDDAAEQINAELSRRRR